MLHYSKSITVAELKAHLTILASDEYEGRKTGEKGQKMAAAYLTDFFKENALIGPVKRNATNNYVQEFDIVERNWMKCVLKTKKKTFRAFEHFFPYQYFEISDEPREVIFVGYGLETANYSDYTDLDVKNKIVVMLKGTPKSITDKLSEKETTATYKVQTAWDKGAALVVFIHDNPETFQNQKNLVKASMVRPFKKFTEARKKTDKGLLFISPKQVHALLGLSTKEYKKLLAKMENKEKSIQYVAKEPVTWKMDINTGVISTENVLAYVEGTDKKDEVVVISAHYDHLGIKDGKVYNGADDDGSGTVALMEIAQAFAQAAAAGHRPRRSILFIAFTGEELGLYGSNFYVENPVFLLEKTTANLNIDMIGRIDPNHNNRNYIYTIGSNLLSSDLHRTHEYVSKKYFPSINIDYTYNSKTHPKRYYYRSDHYNFARYTIPVIFYFSGSHVDYHKPTDTVEKIDFEKIQQTAQLIFCTAWEIANREEELKIDQN